MVVRGWGLSLPCSDLPPNGLTCLLHSNSSFQTLVRPYLCLKFLPDLQYEQGVSHSHKQGTTSFHSLSLFKDFDLGDFIKLFYDLGDDLPTEL